MSPGRRAIHQRFEFPNLFRVIVEWSQVFSLQEVENYCSPDVLIAVLSYVSLQTVITSFIICFLGQEFFNSKYKVAKT